MSLLFNAPVSFGESIKSNHIRQGTLQREMFSAGSAGVPAIFEGDIRYKDGKYFIPGVFSGDARSAGTIIHNTLLTLDIDEATREQLTQALATLKTLSLEYLIHTTTRHTPEHPRVRLILRPSRPVAPHEYKRIIPKIAERLALTVDKAAITPSQPMLLPLVTPDLRELYRSSHRAGEPIDVEAYITQDSTPNRLYDENVALTQELMAACLIPPGIPEALWLSLVCQAYPARGKSYEQWVEMGMALHHQTQGEQPELWIEWSRSSDKHAVGISEHEMRVKKWKSFGLQGKDISPVTMHSILKKPRGPRLPPVAIEVYKLCLTHVEDAQALERLIDTVIQDPLIETHIREIAPAYHRKFNALNNATLSRKEVLVSLYAMLESDDELDNDYFYNHYVWDTQNEVNVELHNRMPIGERTMERRHRQHMPPAVRGGLPQRYAEVMALGGGRYRVPREIVGRVALFGPDAPAVVGEEGAYLLNSCNGKDWPMPARAFDPEDLIDAEIERSIHLHLMLLCNQDETIKNLLLQHLAWMRQRPNERIYWAFCISSRLQGLGKSVMKELYRTVLGFPAVQVVRPQMMLEQYNSWTVAPVKISVCEEFEFPSLREKEAALKNLKEFITGDNIPVRAMRQDTIAGQPVTAFCLFSNDETALGTETESRRWLMISSKVYTKDAAAKALGVADHTSFYDRYKKLMRMHPMRFSAYIDSVSIEGFDHINLPQWADKVRLTQNSNRNRIKQMLDIFIEDRVSVDVTENYILMDSLFKLIRNELDLMDNYEDEDLLNMRSKKLASLTSQVLTAEGYQLLSDLPSERSSARIRLDFDHKGYGPAENQYVTHHIYIRRLPVKNQEQVINIIRHRIRADKEGRLNTPKVINIDKSRYPLKPECTEESEANDSINTI